MKLLFRSGVAADHALVIDSVVTTYRQSPHAQGANNQVIASLVEALLFSDSWRLVIAHPEGEPDTILGFAMHGIGFRFPSIAWLQVRGPFRRHGIGKALLHHIFGPDLPKELHTAFMVQSIDTNSPPLTTLAQQHSITLRFRPYLPLQAALDNAQRMLNPLAHKED